MPRSQAGDGWQPYYEADELSWCIPAKVDEEYIRRHVRSEWIQKILKLTNHQHALVGDVLEAGCGTGLYALCMAILGFNVTAFDYNKRALDFARKLEPHALNVNPNLVIHFSQGNLLNIYAETNAYDLVFNQAVLEYFLEETEFRKAVSEMVRVTKQGGWVAIVVQHTGHPLNSFWKHIGWKGYTNQPPVRSCTPQSLSQELKAAGLKKISVDGIYPWKAVFFWPVWYKRFGWSGELVYLMLRLLERFVPLPRFLRCVLALQIIAVGQKP